ncbi:d-amino acid oxidase [Anopheles darlingi]|uniref:D-amino acid oxidase n=1 Tax=Anopheles darlingi TaxID=43151 RepID=W5JNI5_ANODA|nr:d-amino acid oxidase [Anopheles darlingi]
MNVCVVGAGVVGLTTALELQSELRNANVTVLADRFEQDTCSDVAAGLFRPGTSFSGPTEEITSRTHYPKVENGVLHYSKAPPQSPWPPDVSG